MKPLKDKKIGIIGFNARPIAASTKKLGGKTYVSDYWGDLDLAEAADEFVTVLSPIPGSRQRGSLENPVHLSLADNFLSTFSEVDFDHILIGSSFDDHSESLVKIEKQFGITGNSPEQMSKSRDRDKIARFLRKFDVLIPKAIACSTKKQIIKAAQKIGFPTVVRPRTSGGGSGIRLFSDMEALEFHLDRRKKFDVIVQEYFEGQDFSCSLLSTGRRSVTLSIQGQLIGIPSAGRGCDFVYCGNYLPFSLDTKTSEEVMEVSQSLIDYLGLVGSNGIDFVITNDNSIVFMEVNPRIQGTLEMLEKRSRISVVDQHLKAVKKRLPKKVPIWKPVVKLIAYSRFNGSVPNLLQYPSTVDRSPAGVKVHAGDPVCTVIETGETLHTAYAKAIKQVDSIQRATIGKECG